VCHRSKAANAVNRRSILSIDSGGVNNLSTFIQNMLSYKPGICDTSMLHGDVVGVCGLAGSEKSLMRFGARAAGAERFVSIRNAAQIFA
jgi:sugar diacid utilization regulator